jgi:hypothetical protein
MIVQLDTTNIKRGLLVIVWGAAIALAIYGGFKSSALFGPGIRYAAVDAEALITEFQKSKTINDFLAYKGERDAQAEYERYYIKLKQIADRVAKRENMIIFDAAAIMGVPNATVIDLTDEIKRELANEP